jgi:hypothetical protein
VAVILQLERPPQATDEFTRADLQFRGIDHSGPSYFARIFFEHPDADGSTPLTEEEGYAGSFNIFGHGGCFGELGHCDVHEAPAGGVYDKRLPHPLTPQFKTVVVTDALRRAMRTTRRKNLSITVVAIVPENPASPISVRDPLSFESVSLLIDQYPAPEIPPTHEPEPPPS